MDRDSDDDFETGLPKVPNESVVVEINLTKLLEGESLSFGFEMPERAKTENYQNPPVEKILNRETFEQMKLNFLSHREFPEELETMFGDYSDIEPLMDSIPKHEGIKKRLIRPGTGNKIMERDMVVVNYMVGVDTMDDVLDSTYDSKPPFRFRVGAGKVLPVMEIGVSTMRVGEIAKFLATAEYGYLQLGAPLLNGNIPADSRVLLQIEVLESYLSEKNESISLMSSMERGQIPFQELFAYTEEMKREGKREFNDGEYDRAILLYIEALEAVRDMQPDSSDQKVKYFKIRLELCNNIAQTYWKLGKVKLALKYVEDATQLPINGFLKAKSLYWYSKCLFDLGRYELCLHYIKKADMLWHDNKIRDLKCLVEGKLKEFKENEKQLYSRMMGTTITKKKK